MVRLMLSRRWLPRHALLLALIAAFLVLGRWQWVRADAGNARSVGYAFEWPLFAAVAVWWWWRSMRLELHPPAPQPPLTGSGGPTSPVSGAPAPAAPPAAQPDDEPDDELAAYNRYLAWLHEQDQRQSR